MKRIFVFLLGGMIALCILHCENGDDDDTSTDPGGDSDPDGDTTTEITVTVTVPDDFTAKPQKLGASFYKDSDITAAPIGKGVVIECLDIGVGKSYVYKTHPTQLANMTPLADGEYYMTVALYVEGGGASNPIPIPVKGIDFIGTVDHLVKVGGGPVDAGTVKVEVYE